jgi:hypothetical protein
MVVRGVKDADQIKGDKWVIYPLIVGFLHFIRITLLMCASVSTMATGVVDMVNKTTITMTATIITEYGWC